MPVSKATKKFEKNKLHDVIKRRKDVAKIKQKKQMDVKKKERKSRDNARADDLDGEPTQASKPSQAKDDAFGDMSMDQFFQGGFQIPEMSKKKSAKPKTGKRKRTPVDEDVAESAGQGNPGAQTPGEDSASDSESGDDADAHMEQLAGLAEKDPDFYKYLKENDAELLDFAEDADLAEIDALSASEDEATPRKKQKAADVSDDESEAVAGNELTKKVVQKWKASMESKSSLRAMKEVVLAFRAAAHLNDDESGKAYKYSISDSDGRWTSVLCMHTILTLPSVPRGSRYCSAAHPESASTPSAHQREWWGQDVSKFPTWLHNILTTVVAYPPIRRSFARSRHCSNRILSPFSIFSKTCPMLQLCE
jgi:nucleolar complex protein 2